jgi:hypothetical protein
MSESESEREHDRELLRLVLLHRVLFAMEPFVHLEAKNVLASDPRILSQVLQASNVPRDLRARLQQLLDRSAPLPEFQLVDNWKQLCGTAVSAASKELSKSLTVEKLVCSNNPELGEVRYHQERELVFKSFDIERDWDAVTRGLVADKPSLGFSLTDVARQLLTCSEEPAPCLAACVGRHGPLQLAAAAQQELELMRASAQPSLDVLASLPQASAFPSTILDQVRALVSGFGVTRTDLDLVSADLAELLDTAARRPDSPEFPDLLARCFQDMSDLRARQRANGFLWPQMLSVLRQAGVQSEQVLAERVAKLGALGSMVKVTEQPSAHTRTHLVPLDEQDFAVVFAECRQVFAMCDSPLAHALLGTGRCLVGRSPECLCVCDCVSEAHARQEPALRDTALLLQGKVATEHMHLFEDLDSKLGTLTLAAESRRPLGYYTKYVKVEHALPGEERVTAPDERGFVAVKRAVVPPAAVITFGFAFAGLAGGLLEFVVQAL